MATTDTPKTFSELVTALLNAAKSDTGTTSANRAKRLLNRANHDIHLQNDFWWAERKGMLLTHAPYSTGAVSISASARTTLEGTGTAWSTTVTGMGYANVRTGGKMIFSGETNVYEVATATTATAGTLTSRYIGEVDTASAYALAYGSYTYFEDEYALEADFWRPADLRSFDLNGDISLISRSDFYRRYPRNNVSGSPRVCTLIDLGPSGSTALRPRIVFHPYPDATYTIPYRYFTTYLAVGTSGTGAENLLSDADEPIIPLRYRSVLLYYALREWYRDEKNDQRSQEAEGQYVDLLKRITNDTEPGKDRPRLVAPKRSYGPGPRRSRYSTGSRFDELRD